MYSVILMAGAMTAQEIPQGIFFDRAGCSGARTAAAAGCSGGRQLFAVQREPRVRLFAPTGCGGATFAPLATFNANRPHIIRNIFSHFPHPFRSAGCGGGGGGFIPQAAAADCGGVTVGLAAGPPLKPGELRALGERIQRVAVHRMLARALREGTLTPAQKATAAACLADPELYSMAVRKVTTDLQRSKLSPEMELTLGRFGVLGDGHILQILIDNLPQIIAAIEQIIKMFAAGQITLEQMYALMDQALEPLDQWREQLRDAEFDWLI